MVHIWLFWGCGLQLLNPAVLQMGDTQAHGLFSCPGAAAEAVNVSQQFSQDIQNVPPVLNF